MKKGIAVLMLCAGLANAEIKTVPYDCQTVANAATALEGPSRVTSDGASVTLTFLRKDKTKAVYSFRGTMRHEPARRDVCTVEIQDTHVSPAGVAPSDKLDMLTLVLHIAGTNR